MLNTKVSKIFVETDEEIVFTIEKVKEAGSPRVVLIVPHTAMLLSSATSLKILSRMMLDTNKLLAIVSENELANNLCEKAGLVAVKKVSLVTGDIWQRAKQLKDTMLETRDKNRKELISDRNIPEVEEEIIKSEVVKAEIVDEEPVEDKVIFTSKPRLKEKVVDLVNLKLYSGGDILDNEELLELERQKNNPELEVEFEADNSGKKSSFLTGRDMTMGTESDTRKNKINLNKGNNIFSKIFRLFARLVARFSLIKLILGFVFILALVFLFSYYVLSSVVISIELKESSQTVSKTVTAKTDQTGVALDTLTIPATQVSKTSSASLEAPATGTGSKGEKASGIVTVYNLTDDDITLKAGETFTSPTNLKYKTNTAVTVPKVDAENKPGKIDVSITAESFGTQYNIIGEQKTFQVGAYLTSKVNAVNLLDITGGTTVESVVVSKEDLDSIKATLSEQLKTELITSLKSLIPNDSLLLTGSEKFVDVSFTCDKEENAEAEKVICDYKMTVNGLTVTKADLKKIATEILKNDEQGDMAEVNINDPVLENIKIQDGNVATFDFKTKASIVGDVDLETIKAEIKGKTVEEAKQYIKSIPSVENVIIKYNPPFIPMGIQRIPTDDSKITMNKE